MKLINNIKRKNRFPRSLLLINFKTNLKFKFTKNNRRNYIVCAQRFRKKKTNNVGSSNPPPIMEECMHHSERMLKEKQESHQKQLTSFLTTNGSLREENAILQIVVPTPKRSTSPLPPYRQKFLPFPSTTLPKDNLSRG